MKKHQFVRAIAGFGILALCLIAAHQAGASAERQAAQVDLPLFTEVTESVGMGWPDGEPRLGWGASWGDFNADGFPDLLAGRHFDIPGLFRNNGDGTFTDIVDSTPLTEAGDPHGAAWGDYDNDGDQDLLQAVGGRAGHGPNPQKLYRSDGDGIFVDVAVEAGVDDPLARGRSVSWADYDRDGDLDFFQANSIREDSPNRLWRNNGDSTFTNVAAEAGVEVAIGSTGGSFADYDVDGWPDIYVVHAGGAIVYHNNGDGTFEDVSAQVGFAPAGTPNYAWGDYDADGDLDLFLGISPDPWFDFVEWEGSNARLAGKAAGDEDGIDIEVGGDTLEFRLRIVDGADCDNYSCVHIGGADTSPATNPFIVGAEAYGMPPYTPGVSSGYYIWRDLGTDLWHVRASHPPDAGNFRHESVVTATVSISDVVPIDLEPPPPPGKAMLWRNEGDGTFVEVTAEALLDIGDDFQNPNWVDFDNDGWLDLFVVRRGNVAIGNGPDWLFRNNGDGTFENVAALVGVEGTNEGAGQASAWADYDRNGFLDLFRINCGYGGPVRADCGPEQLFRNEGNGNHWLHLDLVGRVSNREGLGAIVRLTAGGRTLVRAHNDGVERYCQDGDRLHFGLGASTVVDSIVIDWPSGIHQVLTDVPADQLLSITEPLQGNPPVAEDVTASGEEDTVITWTPSVSDPDGDTLTCSVVAQPGNGSAAVNTDCSSGTYTPDLNFNGSDSFSYKANDGQVDSNTALVSVTVNPVNDAPVADAQSVTTEQDMPVDITLTGSDPDGDALTYSVQTPPSHGELTGIAPDLTYTPDLGYDGADSFTFTVNDGTVDSDPATVSIAVTLPGPPNQVQNGGFETDLSFWELEIYGSAAAALSRDDTTAGEDSASARVDVTAPGTFMRYVRFQQTGLSLVEGESYTLAFWAKASVDRPIRVLLRPTSSLWTIFNSLNQDITTTWQRYEHTFTAGGTDTNTTLEFSLGQFVSTVWLDGIELSSSTANNPPVAEDVTASGDEDTVISWTPAVSDPDGDSLTCSIVAQPGSGSAAVNSDCSSGTYTPDPNFNGSDSFSYKGNDGTDDSNPATVFVTVNPVNDAPVADDLSVTTEQDTPVDITLTGSDPDGDVLTYSVVTSPTHGSLSGTAPNLTYTPDPDYNGADSFTFKVNDGSVDSAPATVSIAVTPLGPPNQIQNGGFEADLSSWVLSTYGTAEAVLSRDESSAGEGMASAKVDVTAPGLWLRHVQFTQSGLSLVEGQSYTLAFWARASVDRPIRILLRQSLFSYYNDLGQTITTTWQRYEHTFTAGGTDANATLEFSLGQYGSTVWLDGIELLETGP